MAGRELINGEPGAWVRPVSARPDQAVSENERLYVGGSEPQVLDVLDIPLQRWQPENHQRENWLLDPDNVWTRVGTVTWGSLEALVDPSAPLWLNGFGSSTSPNDRVPVDKTHDLDNALRSGWRPFTIQQWKSYLDSSIAHSLRLIRVSDMRLQVFQTSTGRRVRGIFSYRSSQYRL